MPFALTIDQRGSRSTEDLVDRWVDELNTEFGDSLRLHFVATVGDELQGLTDDPAVAVDVVLRGVQFEQWWVGVGIGAIELPLKQSAARSRGSAFYRARAAVELAKKERWGFAVAAEDESMATQAASALQLLAFIVHSRGQGPRSQRTWQAVKMRSQGAKHDEIAEALSITRQAVSRRLSRAGYDEEETGRALGCALLQQAESASDG